MPPRRTRASAHRCRAVADRASTANNRQVISLTISRIVHMAREVTMCSFRWSSGRLPVGVYFGHRVGRLAGDVDPAGVAVAGDAHADERVEGVLVDAVV